LMVIRLLSQIQLIESWARRILTIEGFSATDARVFPEETA